jgi:hypothetical protein
MMQDDGQVALLFTDPELKGLFQEACRSFLVEESLLFLFTVQDLRVRHTHMTCLAPLLTLTC